MTDSTTGINASASCSLHSSIISRSCCRAGVSRCCSGALLLRVKNGSGINTEGTDQRVEHLHLGICLVVLNIHHGSHIDIRHVCYLKLGQTAPITCALHRIPQWIGEVMWNTVPPMHMVQTGQKTGCMALRQPTGLWNKILPQLAISR